MSSNKKTLRRFGDNNNNNNNNKINEKVAPDPKKHDSHTEFKSWKFGVTLENYVAGVSNMDFVACDFLADVIKRKQYGINFADKYKGFQKGNTHTHTPHTLTH